MLERCYTMPKFCKIMLENDVGILDVRRRLFDVVRNFRIHAKTKHRLAIRFHQIWAVDQFPWRGRPHVKARRQDQHRRRHTCGTGSKLLQLLHETTRYRINIKSLTGLYDDVIRRSALNSTLTYVNTLFLHVTDVIWLYIMFQGPGDNCSMLCCRKKMHVLDFLYI